MENLFITNAKDIKISANAAALENHTVLAWDPVRRADGSIDPAVSYQVLCRETDQPKWTVLDKLSFDPSLLTPGYRCPFSKDNYFFAVRAVSAAGNPSLPALAR
ncbi:MAG: fibronectin type III domain-containing protein [Bacteroidales bacterium]|nr:fibronectin type III domain-containing protein [Bacteroidales bacterium]